jgi:cation:H+ antiporter
LLPLSDAHLFPLWVNAAIFVAAGVVVWIGGTRLTGYVDELSVKTGLGEAFAGMLLLGAITSLPELANTITASAMGNPALGINNLLGSAAINIFLLAVGDAIVGRDALTSVVAKPSTLMMSVLCMLVLVITAVAITIGDVALLGIGGWGVLVTAASIGAFWLAAGYGARSPWGVVRRRRHAEEAEQGEDADSGRSLRQLVLLTAVAGAIIFVAGYTLSQSGEALAEQTGLGTGIVGFALIGIATSLPELSTVVESMRRRRYELAFGQVLGTNFVNLAMVLVADIAFMGGPVMNELGRFEVVSSLLGAALIGVFLVGLLERRDATILRMGYDSLAVMILFLGGLVMLALL